MSAQRPSCKGMALTLLGTVIGLAFSAGVCAQDAKDGVRGCGTSQDDYVEAGQTSEWTINTKQKSEYQLKLEEGNYASITNSGFTIPGLHWVFNGSFEVASKSQGGEKNVHHIVFTHPKCKEPENPNDPNRYRVIESAVTLDEINPKGEVEAWAAETGTAVRTK